MPERDIRIRQAIEIIGPEQPADHLIAPARHAGEYAERAPKLARLLQWSEIRVAAEELTVAVSSDPIAPPEPPADAAAAELEAAVAF